MRALAGAPTADVASLLRALDEIDGAPAEWALARELPTDEIRRLLGVAAAPEGVDAADELRIRLFAALGLDGRATPRPTIDELVIAVRDKSDELAAAQAAIQRVRAVAERHTRASFIARDVLRELDGDTTEEKR